MTIRPEQIRSTRGERLPVNSVRLLRRRVRCNGRGRETGAARLGFIVILTGALICAFVVGRMTAPTQPFQFIGTPVYEVEQNPSEAVLEASNGAVDGAEQKAPPSNETVCGAPTRSGKPCQRKVRLGGRCWQHRGGEPKQ